MLYRSASFGIGIWWYILSSADGTDSIRYENSPIFHIQSNVGYIAVMALLNYTYVIFDLLYKDYPLN